MGDLRSSEEEGAAERNRVFRHAREAASGPCTGTVTTSELAAEDHWSCDENKEEVFRGRAPTAWMMSYATLPIGSSSWLHIAIFLLLFKSFSATNHIFFLH